MKLKSFFAVTIAALATSVSFADQGDAVVSFSTPGPDKYSNGSTVADGEWYALCWSANESFGGFKTDGSPLVEGDAVILAAPLAKGGKCPFTVFEFARDTYTGGKYFVMLLDTRDANGNPAKTRADVFLKNGAVANSVAAGNSAEAQTAIAAGGASVAWSAPTVLGQAQIDKAQAATIKSFAVVDANVQITVAGAPDDKACFVLRTGESVEKMNTYTIEAPSSSASSETTFVVPQEKGKFFSVGTLAK